ncbi:MAG: phycobilisome rod-core linker polypeptide [Cyanobacteria bacterium P01_D01_bin.56]
MVSTFTNSVITSGNRISQAFQDTAPVELWSGDSAERVDIVIRAVYRQVLGNAHVMESERLVVPESQLKNGELSVREFVRQVAKSDLYRSRFAENCYRYRAVELNFKHLLGRAPQSFEEMKAHSAILDTEGYDADIDSYINSDEYNNAFGENVVPYYRGHLTAPGQTALEFTHMLKLVKGASSSDKDVTDNTPRVANTILRYQPNRGIKSLDNQDILAMLLKQEPVAAESSLPAIIPATGFQNTAQTLNKQDALIAKLKQQLNELRSSAGIGAAILRKGNQPRTQLSNPSSTAGNDKAAIIERLQGELMEARALATIGESRLNKWRR